MMSDFKTQSKSTQGKVIDLNAAEIYQTSRDFFFLSIKSTLNSKYLPVKTLENFCEKITDEYIKYNFFTIIRCRHLKIFRGRVNNNLHFW